MYIGDTAQRGLHHLVYEIVDNSIDEAMAGFCTNIIVRITADNAIVVIDDGRGIPTDINKAQGSPGVTVALTKLHAGGKFNQGVYKVSGGLHGVGASVVNALSEVCEVEVYQNGHIHFQAFSRGTPVGPLERRGRSDRRGTKIFFKPDHEIFGRVQVRLRTRSRLVSVSSPSSTGASPSASSTSARIRRRRRSSARTAVSRSSSSG